MVQPKFTTIPATRPLAGSNKTITDTRKRVCAYCRVSTEEFEQVSSYNLQIEYYTQFIQKHPDWQFKGIFADYAKSGTSTEKRTEFMKMIQTCKKGRIDLIITKSISRFARNTLDCLYYVRMLRSLSPPVEIYFEKENLHTFDAKSEMLMTILSCIAQDEARNISENVKWSIQKKYQSGQPRCPTNYLLGYEKDSSGNLRIKEEEAKTVRRIFQEYLDGKGARSIAGELKAEGILSGRGTVNWGKTSVLHILENEKYCGDVLMQKDYTVDFLTHKRKRNEGELPKYHLQDHHEPIIDRKTWEMAQTERKRRRDMITEKDRNLRQVYSSVSVFSNRLFCGTCGQPLTRYSGKIVVNGQKENHPLWRCRATSLKACKKGGYARCRAKRKQEGQIRAGFMKMLLELKQRQIPDAGDEALKSILLQLNGNSQFKDEYFRSLIDHEVVYDDGTVKYIFQSGRKIVSHL